MKLFLTILAILALSMAAYAITEETVKLSELERYQLQAIAYRADYESLWMRTAIQSFIDSNPQVKEHQQAAIQAEREYSELELRLYTAAKLDKTTHRLNVREGQFEKIIRGQ